MLLLHAGGPLLLGADHTLFVLYLHVLSVLLFNRSKITAGGYGATVIRQICVSFSATNPCRRQEKAVT